VGRSFIIIKDLRVVTTILESYNSSTLSLKYPKAFRTSTDVLPPLSGTFNSSGTIEVPEALRNRIHVILQSILTHLINQSSFREPSSATILLLFSLSCLFCFNNLSYMLYRIQCSYIIICSVLNDDPMDPWRKYRRCRRRCRRHVLTMEEGEPQFCYQHRTLGLAAMASTSGNSNPPRPASPKDGMDPSNPGNVNDKATPGGSNTGGHCRGKEQQWKQWQWSTSWELKGHPWPPGEAPDGFIYPSEETILCCWTRTMGRSILATPISSDSSILTLQNAFREMVLDTLMMCSA